MHIKKRDTLRSIFLQILIFSLNAVYTMCVIKDGTIIICNWAYLQEKSSSLLNSSARLKFQ